MLYIDKNANVQQSYQVGNTRSENHELKTFAFHGIIFCRAVAIVWIFSVIMIIRSLSFIGPSGEVNYKFRNTVAEDEESWWGKITRESRMDRERTSGCNISFLCKLNYPCDMLRAQVQPRVCNSVIF
jgi:hypothetical protein